MYDANFSGVGVGRVWPLLAGERGHLVVLAGDVGIAQLTAMLKMPTQSGLLLQEQVWDQSSLYPAERGTDPAAHHRAPVY